MESATTEATAGEAATVCCCLQTTWYAHCSMVERTFRSWIPLSLLELRLANCNASTGKGTSRAGKYLPCRSRCHFPARSRCDTGSWIRPRHHWHKSVGSCVRHSPPHTRRLLQVYIASYYCYAIHNLNEIRHHEQAAMIIQNVFKIIAGPRHSTN